MSENCLKIAYFDSYAFNIDTGELHKNGEKISLRPKAAKVLAKLIEGQGEVMTKETLYGYVWGKTVVQRQDGLHQLIKDIRNALDEDSQTIGYLQNVPGIGYKFCGELLHIPEISRPRIVPRSLAYMAGILTFPIIFLGFCLVVV
jgi:DNA-binding winged helix-turn-helix (wHTH) protein